MAKAEKSGTYVDEQGNFWWIREGDDLPHGAKPGETTEIKKSGAPENRAEGGAPEKRTAKGAR
jgi:hypothetical protein